MPVEKKSRPYLRHCCFDRRRQAPPFVFRTLSRQLCQQRERGLQVHFVQTVVNQHCQCVAAFLPAFSKSECVHRMQVCFEAPNTNHHGAYAFRRSVQRTEQASLLVRLRQGELHCPLHWQGQKSRHESNSRHLGGLCGPLLSNLDFDKMSVSRN